MLPSRRAGPGRRETTDCLRAGRVDNWRPAWPGRAARAPVPSVALPHPWASPFTIAAAQLSPRGHSTRNRDGLSDASYPPYPAPKSFAASQGKRGGGTMKVVWLAVAIAITATLAHAEDMAELISRYRRAHGHGVRKHSGWHQDLGGDVPDVAGLAGPQCEPLAIEGRQRRGRRRPQRKDPLQNVLGD